MAYQLRVYAPTTGVTSLRIRSSSGATLGTVAPAGEGTPCFNKTGLTTGAEITPTLASGYIVSRWIVNVDGTRYEQYTTTCSIGYVADASNIQIRVEVEQIEQETYYVNIDYDANGGSGAPASELYSGQSPTLTVWIQDGEPTRKGYIFLGWATSPTATNARYQPGQRLSSWEDTGTWDGYTVTLYAVWSKQETAGGVYVGNGPSMIHGTAYIYRSGWGKATPYIYQNGWKKGT